jgi:hypothetical protein
MAHLRSRPNFRFGQEHRAFLSVNEFRGNICHLYEHDVGIDRNDLC